MEYFPTEQILTVSLVVAWVFIWSLIKRNKVMRSQIEALEVHLTQTASECYAKHSARREVNQQRPAPMLVSYEDIKRATLHNLIQISETIGPVIELKKNEMRRASGMPEVKEFQEVNGSYIPSRILPPVKKKRIRRRKNRPRLTITETLNQLYPEDK